MLELKSLGKTFGATRAVDDVSLSIPAGSMVGVIGRSGAGKSTLLRLINRLCEPTSGEVLWQGKPVSRLQGRALSEWRACCGMVFQQFNLAPRLDVLTNVLTGSLCRNQGLAPLFKIFPQAERARAILELHALDMADAALQRCCTLSGGQQQRVAIARALVCEPRMILADEPTGALDSQTGKEIMDLFLTLHHEGRTMILVTHDERIAAQCARRITLADGNVVAESLR